MKRNFGNSGDVGNPISKNYGETGRINFDDFGQRPRRRILPNKDRISQLLRRNLDTQETFQILPNLPIDKKICHYQ